MSTLKNTLLSLLILTGSFYAEQPITNNYNTQYATYTKPANTTRTIINRYATKFEIVLADAQAARALANVGKSSFATFEEFLDENTRYLYNAQPLGIEHGLVKGTGIVAAALASYYIYNAYFSNDPKLEKSK